MSQASVEILRIKTSREPWAEEAIALYSKKLKPFCDVQVSTYKSKAQERSQALQKKTEEAKIFLKHLRPGSYVILLDEKGQRFKDSVEWSQVWQGHLDRGQKDFQLLIGGPYGVDESLKRRANEVWSLSPLTMNHHLGLVVTMEQLYRGFTIHRGLPYHNL